MGSVDLLDQRAAAYKLDKKSSSGCYYFEFIDIAVVNSHVVYNAL